MCGVGRTACLLTMICVLSGCGAAATDAHSGAKTSAVDQVLKDRAEEADVGGGNTRSDLILTPKSYREQDSTSDTEGVDAQILAQAREIADAYDVQDPSLTGDAAGTDWRQVDLSDTGDGFPMAEMPADCDVDVDLTILNSSMVYAEVYNMMYYPEKYIGKRVRMRGTYSYYKDEATGKVYLACFISDAAACCQQGIEFAFSDPEKEKKVVAEHEDYDDIQVVGVYDTYEEDGVKYCTLRDAVMEDV